MKMKVWKEKDMFGVMYYTPTRVPNKRPKAITMRTYCTGDCEKYRLCSNKTGAWLCEECS